MRKDKGKPRRDISGNKYGKWTVLKIDLIDDNGNTKWVCQCDCGTIRSVVGRNLIHGRSTSCGCAYHKKKGKESLLWKGFGDISGKEWSSVKAHARERGLQFDISIEDAWAILVNQNFKCALSGQHIGSTKKEGASLDRIDNKLGYTKGNVQWLHKDVNWMKGRFEQGRFLDLCRMISEVSQEEALTIAA